VVTNVFDRLRALALAVFLIAFAMPAFAGPFEDAVGKFATDDFSDTEEAIGVVASSGNPLAFPVISALQEERLMFDADTKKVYIKQADGKAIDAATELRSTAFQTAPVWSASTTACAARWMRGRRPDAAVARCRDADHGRAVGLQVARRIGAAQCRECAREGNQQDGEAGIDRSARRRPAVQIRYAEVDKLDAIATVKARGDQDALGC